MDLKATLSHPLTTVLVGLSAVLQTAFGAFGPVWEFLVATSSYWFPAIATTSATILPEVGYGDLGTKLLLGAAVVFVAVQVDGLIDRAAEYLRNR